MTSGPVGAASPTCSLELALALVGGKWKPSILCALEAGPRSAGELRRALEGISDKVLRQQLAQLDADGLVRRTPRAGERPGVDYALAREGAALLAALEPLAAWAASRVGVPS